MVQMTVYAVNLIPAYGRDYSTPQEVLEDWAAGKDFKIADIGNQYDGRYTSIRDWTDKPVRIRFNKRADFVIVRDNQIEGR
jgi:hypothetical protein